MSLERIERKSGAVWRVRWRDDGGRERSKVIGRKRDAEAFEAEVIRRKRTGDLDLLSGGRETLADFAQEWWRLYATPNLASRTLRSYAHLWDRHVLPRLGSMRLAAITPEVVERYRAPIQVERLREVVATRRKHGARDAVMLSLLAYAGLRPQEALALRWGDVRERTLLVEKAGDGQGGVKGTKTGQARTVRLLAPLARDLAEWRELRGSPGDDELLFPTPSGGIWNDTAWQTWHRDAWLPARKATGLNGARPYDLRHSFVSLLIHEGRSVVDVARQAGHSPTMTLDVYAHVLDEFDIAERVSAEDRIEQARRDVSESCPPGSGTAQKPSETPANPHSPIPLPMISFITSSVPPPIGPRRASRTARSMPYSRM
jgi:integrase